MEVLKELKWLLIILVVMWVIWFLTGGATKFESQKPFIKPAAPLDSGEVYGPKTR